MSNRVYGRGRGIHKPPYKGAGVAVLVIFGLMVAGPVLQHVVPAVGRVGRRLLPQVDTAPPPPPPVSSHFVPWPPDSDNDDDDEVERYYGDMVVSDVIARYGSNTVMVIFGRNSQLRTGAMRLMVRDIYIDLIKVTMAGAVKALEYQENALRTELVKAKRLPLGVFRWQTKAELRRNLGEIKRTQQSLKQINQQARREANNLSSWSSPTSTYVQTSSGGGEYRQKLEFGTGSATGQLKRISTDGVWANQ